MGVFVVTGTPRAATGYASLLLSAANVPCSHETIFRPRTALQDILEWCEGRDHKGESSWLSWVFLGWIPLPVKVLHSVRNPWHVADSLANRNDILPVGAELSGQKAAYRRAVRAYCPRVYEFSEAIDRAACMVVDWNAAIEKASEGRPYKRFRVEDMTADLLAELLDWLGIRRDAREIRRAVESVPRNVNGGKRIEYQVEVKHPLLRAYLQKQYPDQPPVIGRLMSVDRKRSVEEIEEGMNQGLREELTSIAKRYGYSRGDCQGGKPC